MSTGVLTIDFETEPRRPGVPWPEPVGVAVQVGGRPASYHHWGHHVGPPSYPREKARVDLQARVDEAKVIVMFNAPFDVGVGRVLGVSIPWDRVVDVGTLAFLADPGAPRRGLKAFAHVECGISPDEQDTLWRWISVNVKAARGRKRLGAFIADAPGDLVSPYARGDCHRTYQLYLHWRHLVSTPACVRERAMLEVCDQMRVLGMPIDREALSQDLPSMHRQVELSERYLRSLLGGGAVDLNRKEVVADRMEAAGLITEWIETAKGHRSLAHENLTVLVAEGKADARFVAAWGYRSVLVHTVRTFAEPWLAWGDRVHAQWVPTRREGLGAVTGRLSSTPNVQNIIKNPAAFDVPRSWDPLPQMRRYVRAPSGHLLVGADISQQELRILADCVGPPLRNWYVDEPDLDIHRRVQEEIHRVTGFRISRDGAKAINLAGIYGQGTAATAAKLRTTYDTALSLQRAHGRAIPGMRDWTRAMRRATAFATAGGRRYLGDPQRPYKNANTRIQGSAADQLKEIMVGVQPVLRANHGASLCMTAHDELVVLAPAAAAAACRRLLLGAIESTGLGGSRQMFAVPMLGTSYVRERWKE